MLDVDKIYENLKTEFIGRKVIYLNSVDSTNEVAKIEAGNSLAGTIVLADEQTGGKGRNGRRWISKSGEGIWMSLILKPSIQPKDASLMTIVAGAAVCKSLNDMGVDAEVKWPNDLVLNGKKIAGILSELCLQGDEIGYLVVGIGINVSTLKFDEEIERKASSLLKEGFEIERETLIFSVLNEFEELYKEYVDKGEKTKILDININRSALIGKRIYLNGNESRLVDCIGLSEEGSLIVQDEYGNRIEVNSGEVSVRGENGYV
ncbi:MAG: biotin--[acetyl-CoA-carboxylase] ligase [Clostridioides sp.]|jgi:BirA family biotin operon repressor/biotin-[acetyl-CoA-carboxylase] ligase|nr:biotin--[acetyl-CoA-carboxylase] ligase [Clostridioides sp.]